MTLFNQFSVSISLIVIAIILTISIILIAIIGFKINNNLKKHNELIQLAIRPFLTFELSKKQIVIKNTGKSGAIIDTVYVDEQEITDLSNIQINPKQICFIPIEKVKTVSVKYHSGADIYQDSINL